MRAELEGNYREALRLWFLAVLRGDLKEAAEMMRWRVALGAALRRDQ
jgi:hypothetical protein